MYGFCKGNVDRIINRIFANLFFSPEICMKTAECNMAERLYKREEKMKANNVPA